MRYFEFSTDHKGRDGIVTMAVWRRKDTNILVMGIHYTDPGVPYDVKVARKSAREMAEGDMSWSLVEKAKRDKQEYSARLIFMNCGRSKFAPKWARTMDLGMKAYRLN